MTRAPVSIANARRRPLAIELLLFDVQDIGARTYTYISRNSTTYVGTGYWRA